MSHGFFQVDNLKAQLEIAGYDQYSVYDLMWQSLHMSAAAACRGSTPTGGSGPSHNVVLARNTADKKNCTELCAATTYSNCDAEVSIYGLKGKATENGQLVGRFYNFGCDRGDKGGYEVSTLDKAIMQSGHMYYSYCCCRKP